MIRDSPIPLLEPLLKVEGESLASFPSAIVSLLTGSLQTRLACCLAPESEGGRLHPPSSWRLGLSSMFQGCASDILWRVTVQLA